MKRVLQRFGRLVSALIVVLLIGAQTVSVAHAYEHDLGTIQDAACATCISVNQLSAIAVDTGQAYENQVFVPVYHGDLNVLRAATEVQFARQRGPPATL